MLAEQTGSAPSDFSFALVNLPILPHLSKGITEQCVWDSEDGPLGLFSRDTHSGEDTWFFGGYVCQCWDLWFLHLELVVTNGAFPTGLRPIKWGS